MSISKQYNLRQLGEQHRREDGNLVDREVAYQALSNRRRRFIVHFLLRERKPISLRVLSKQVAAWENAVPRKQVTSKQRKRVYTALHQAHLPKLDKMGIIEYDNREMVAHPTEKLGTLRVYMDVVPEDEIPWSVFYTGIALSFGSGALFGWAGFLPFDVLPGYLWALIISLVIVTTGLFNIHSEYRNQLAVEGPPPEVEQTEPS
ncbi:DUF7344 domain-containing protein [Halostagnicola bangensis]